jgi:hypothetical protein
MTTLSQYRKYYNTSDANIVEADLPFDTVAYGANGRIGQRASWNPTVLETLERWYEASTENLFQDSTRTTPVTSDADPVGSWTDLTGNGNHFSQSTEANRGIFKAAVPEVSGDRSGIYGDGSNDHLIAPNYTPDSPYMIGVYFNHAVSEIKGLFSLQNTLSSGSPHMFIRTNSTGAQLYISGAYAISWADTFGQNNSVVVRVTQPSSNWLVDAWLNGVKATQYNAGTVLANQTAQGLYALNSFGGYSTNKLMTVIVATGVFTDEEAMLLHQYMAGEV